MKTFIQLENELYDRYQNNFDFQKIYNNSQRGICKALNLILCYGNSGCFGGPDCDHDFSSEEKDWMTLRLIELFIDDPECLLEIEKMDWETAFSNDKSFKHYLKFYKESYRSLLSHLHDLRNRFRNIKALDPENYPGWIDDWELCLDIDIGERSWYLIDLKYKKLIFDMNECTTDIIVIIQSLVERCDKLIKRYNAGTRKGKGVAGATSESSCAPKLVVERENQPPAPCPISWSVAA